MMKHAIYPGTFDPITNGHVDLIERASCLFERLIIAIATSARKQPFFSLEDRMAMITELFSGNKRVVVMPLAGLLVNFAKQHNVSVIVRGLRAVSDFDYEFQLAGMNRTMAPEIETILLPAAEKHLLVSATIVREIITVGGNPEAFVPAVVMRWIRQKVDL